MQNKHSIYLNEFVKFLALLPTYTFIAVLASRNDLSVIEWLLIGYLMLLITHKVYIYIFNYDAINNKQQMLRYILLIFAQILIITVILNIS